MRKGEQKEKRKEKRPCRNENIIAGSREVLRGRCDMWIEKNLGQRGVKKSGLGFEISMLTVTNAIGVELRFTFYMMKRRSENRKAC